MLTPVEIQSKSFKSGGLGYDKRDVDAFKNDVYKNYEALYRNNMELKDKVSVLTEGIQYYKSIEKTLQKALLLAERTAEETQNAANKEAERIKKEAVAKANIMLADAKNELDQLHAQTVALIQQYEKYKAQFKALAAAQIDLLDSDAFSINVQRLDAFISESSFVKSTRDYVNGTPEKTDESLEENTESEKEAADDVKEIISDKREVSFDNSDDNDEFDFSDIEIEGQEEFDFLGMNEK